MTSVMENRLMTTNRSLHYVASTYQDQGGPVVTCILITRDSPRVEDYEILPSFEDDKFVDGKLKNDVWDRIEREFNEIFGRLYWYTAKSFSKDDFFRRYGNHLPEYLKREDQGVLQRFFLQVVV
jgi:hypothetical protein